MAWVNAKITKVFQVRPLPSQCVTSRFDSQTPHDSMCVTMGDGSVRNVNGNVSITTWRAVITPNGGDQLGADWN